MLVDIIAAAPHAKVGFSQVRCTFLVDTLEGETNANDGASGTSDSDIAIPRFRENLDSRERRLMTRKAFCMLLMFIGLGGPLFPKTQESATGGFDKLRALSGDWEGTVAWTGKSASKVSAHYYVTGNGSAVVEELSNGMTSVYHLDGADLRVTHYCAAQNQPRLRASSFGTDNNDIRFSFVDITNLRSPSDGHVSGLEIRFLESDHIEITFQFTSNGKDAFELVDLRRKE